jgi:hypothetical protein
MGTVSFKEKMVLITGLVLMALMFTWWSYKENGRVHPLAKGISQSVQSIKISQHDLGTRFE